MGAELLVQRGSDGAVYDLSAIVTTLSWTTNRNNTPGKLDFSFTEEQSLGLSEGDVVRFTYDGWKVFYGFIFTREKKRWGEVTVTCYDQMRYLKAKGSYHFTGKKTGEILTQVALEHGLTLGKVADTGYRIPSVVKNDTSLLDLIGYCNDRTKADTGKVFVLFDDFGALSLLEPLDLQSDVLLGSRSMVTDFTRKTDIDTETYNYVKLAQPNKATDRADTYVVEHSGTIARWGKLQYYEKVDENLNAAQIKSRAEMLLQYYNRVLGSGSVEALGVPGVRAGGMAPILLPDFQEFTTNQWFLVDKCTHKFKNGSHTMSLEVRLVKNG